MYTVYMFFRGGCAHVVRHCTLRDAAEHLGIATNHHFNAAWRSTHTLLSAVVIPED